MANFRIISIEPCGADESGSPREFNITLQYNNTKLNLEVYYSELPKYKKDYRELLNKNVDVTIQIEPFSKIKKIFGGKSIKVKEGISYYVFKGKIIRKISPTKYIINCGIDIIIDSRYELEVGANYSVEGLLSIVTEIKDLSYKLQQPKTKLEQSEDLSKQGIVVLDVDNNKINAELIYKFNKKSLIIKFNNIEYSVLFNRNYYQTLRDLDRRVNKEGYKILCNGTSKHVFCAGFCLNMAQGERVYYKNPNTGKLEVKDTFAYEEWNEYAKQEEQEKLLTK